MTQPVPSIWTTLATLSGGPSDMVLSAGGMSKAQSPFDLTNCLPAAYVLSTQLWSWAQTADMPACRVGHASRGLAHVSMAAVVFGGGTGLKTPSADLWLWQAGAWSSIEAPAGTGPAPRWFHAMVTRDNASSPVGQDLVVHGGVGVDADTGEYVLLGDTWVFTFSNANGTAGQWYSINGPAPSGFGEAAAAVANGDVYLTGGCLGVGLFPFCDMLPGQAEVQQTTWRLDFATGAWTMMPSANAPLSFFATLVATPAPTESLMLYGGQMSRSSIINQTFIMPLSGSFAPVTMVAPTEEQAQVDWAPAPRYGQAAVWAEHLQSMVVFAGEGWGGFFNDLWVFRPPRLWQAVALNAQPPPIDAVQQVITLTYAEKPGGPLVTNMFMFGGLAPSTVWGSAWRYSVSSQIWLETQTQGSPNIPSARLGHTLVPLPTGDGYLLFGGSNTGTE